MRLDVHLVEAGLARSRGQARDLVASGAVTVDGRVARRPAAPVTADSVVEVASDDARRWVGRAALKLVGALEAFPEFAATIPGARCVDVGASTGGFTQVLLENGASHVVAIDVGHHQLAAPVRDDPRVEDRSGLNVREVTTDDVAPCDVLVADLSFISLTLVADVLRALLTGRGQAVLLVKPQFEVGRHRLGKAGVVRSASDRREALVHVVETLRAAGLAPSGLAPSPTPGTTGNREYLLWIGGRTTLDPREVLTRADVLIDEEV
ncbi:TlyA family RNA methyltransferase [Mobilicoccus pelagius]|nr:TlyA family RNA methyltransferase [Mobilicoccus pelagius]